MINFLRKIVPRKLTLLYHRLWAITGVILYGLPTNKMHVIGVTGTNGKTTTVNLINAILEEAGKKTGMISTVNFRINGIEWLNKSKMTTQGRFTLRKLLKRMLSSKCEYAILEVSSHAITQSRIWALNFDTAVLTNFTHDHLDYHKTMDAYRNTKGQLFSDTVSAGRTNNTPKRIILNKDSRSYEYFSKFQGDENYTYGMASKNLDVYSENERMTPEGTEFTAVTLKGKINIKTNLVGQFNIYNTLAAIAVGISEKIPLKVIAKALGKFRGVPGRMEKVSEGQNFTVIVDYAHTPDAFEKIFENIKTLSSGRIISVFGATGDRDKSKRPILGKIAAKYCTYSFLTLEDPASEDPVEIINEIEPGFIEEGKKEGIDYFEIIDRREAIKRAFEIAGPNDVVLLLAKGHETVMTMKNGKTQWDDRQVAREELQKLLKKKHAK